MRDYVVLTMGQGLSYKLDKFSDDQRYKMIQSVWSKAKERPVATPVLRKLMHTYLKIHASFRFNYEDFPSDQLYRKYWQELQKHRSLYQQQAQTGFTDIGIIT